MQLWRSETGFRAPLTGLVGLVFLAVSGACERDDTIAVDRNLPPETFVTLGPEPSENPNNPTDLYYRAHLFWRGEDADGTIAGFRFAIDDTADAGAWTFTSRTDSVFRFSVGALGSREHLFLIRAVDDLGKEDPTPDTLRFESFTSANPVVDFVSNDFTWIGGSFDSLRFDDPVFPCIPGSPNDLQFGLDPGDTISVCGEVTFVWTGSDEDGEIIAWESRFDNEVEWRLHQRDDTTRTESNIPPGGHVLSVRAIDDAGAVSASVARFPFVSNFDPVTTIDSRSLVATLERPWLGPESTLVVSYDDGVAVRDTFPYGSSVSFCWSSTDIDGPVVRYRVTVDDITVETMDTRPFTSMDTCAVDIGPVLATSGLTPLELEVQGVDIHTNSEGNPSSVEFHANFPPIAEIAGPDTITITTGVEDFPFSATDVDSDPAVMDFSWRFSFRASAEQFVTLAVEDRVIADVEISSNLITSDGVPHLLTLQARDVGGRVSAPDSLHFFVVPASSTERSSSGPPNSSTTRYPRGE